jgi:hypothetical protein
VQDEAAEGSEALTPEIDAGEPVTPLVTERDRLGREQLESETKVRLRPFLQKYGMKFVEEPGSGEQVAGFIALYQNNSWLDFLAALKPLIDQFLARFQEISNAGPAEDQDVLQSMIKHEKSFVHWIEKETAGEEGSLDAAISQLQYPLVAP